MRMLRRHTGIAEDYPRKSVSELNKLPPRHRLIPEIGKRDLDGGSETDKWQNPARRRQIQTAPAADAGGEIVFGVPRRSPMHGVRYGKRSTRGRCVKQHGLQSHSGVRFWLWGMYS